MKIFVKKISSFIITFFSILNLCSCFDKNNKLKNEVKPQTQKISEILYEKNNYKIENIEKGFIATSMNNNQITQKYDEDHLTEVIFNSSSNKDNHSMHLQKDIVNKFYYNDSSEIKKINNNGNIYEFIYDDNFNFLYGTIDGEKRYRNYFDKDNNLIKTIYSNGDVKEFIYDNNKLKLILFNGNLQYSYEYLENSIIEKNYSINETTIYILDDENNLLSFYTLDSKIIGEFIYHEDGSKLNDVKYKFNNEEFKTNYRENCTKFRDNYIKPLKDDFNRDVGYIINDQNFKFSYSSDDTYDVLPIEFTYLNNNFKFIYNDIGLLIEVDKNGEQYVTYKYDVFDQLIEEYYFDLNYKISYCYDDRGNILKKEDNRNGERIYQYSFDNKLINCNSSKLTYDLNGNIVNINDCNLRWNGKQLIEFKNNFNTIQYSYNSNGLRVSKKVNGEITYYQLLNDKVVFEYNDTNFIYYIYDNEHNIAGFYYDGKAYFYIKNNTRDVIGIINEDNEQVVSYIYDGFGNILNIIDKSDNDIGLINPYRYKSYRYDSETNLYYLNSRYYSPNLGRFISEDDIKSINNEAQTFPYINLYCYGLNNPIKYFDPYGDFALAIAGITISTKALLFLGVTILVSVVISYLAKEINEDINKYSNGFVNLLKSVVSSLPSLWDIWTKSSKPEIHHIVAKAASAAKPARDTCSRYGINVYSDINNLVLLKSRFHRKLHTNTYYIAVNTLIVSSNNKNQIYLIMNGIKTFLEILNVIA